MGGGDNRLCVSVSKCFCEPLTCKIRVKVRVDGHLVTGLTSQSRERGDYRDTSQYFHACESLNDSKTEDGTSQ